MHIISNARKLRREYYFTDYGDTKRKNEILKELLGAVEKNVATILFYHKSVSFQTGKKLGESIHEKVPIQQLLFVMGITGEDALRQLKTRELEADYFIETPNDLLGAIK